MGKIKNNQNGFSIIEVGLLAVIVGLISFVGWYVYHANKKTSDTLNKAANTSQTAPKTIKSTTSISPNGSAISNQTFISAKDGYLPISEYGIKIPLTSDISDLVYTPPPKYNGHTFPGVYLYSSTKLSAETHAVDPLCAASGPYGLIEGVYIIDKNPDDPQSTPSVIATDTVNGKTYYIAHHGSGDAGCEQLDSAQSTNTDKAGLAQDIAAKYTDEVVAAFKNAQAL